MIDLEDIPTADILADINAYMAKRGVPHYSIFWEDGRWRLLGPKSENIAGALREAADTYELAERPAVLN